MEQIYVVKYNEREHENNEVANMK